MGVEKKSLSRTRVRAPNHQTLQRVAIPTEESSSPTAATEIGHIANT